MFYDHVPGAAPGARLLVPAPIAAGTAARDEIKRYLRIEGTDEDVSIDALAAVAIGHGEAFTGRLWLTRAVSETLRTSAMWTRLGASPVRSITSVSDAPAAGGGAVLAIDAYAIDIDAGGDGWVRVSASAGTRVTVAYQAGIAAGWSALPEPLRQGAVRLAAHLFAHRDADDEAPPPASIAALWRPWRRMRLS